MEITLINKHVANKKIMNLDVQLRSPKIEHFNQDIRFDNDIPRLGQPN